MFVAGKYFKLSQLTADHPITANYNGLLYLVYPGTLNKGDAQA